MFIKITKYAGLLLLMLMGYFIFNAILIHQYASNYFDTYADVGIVLGAGTSNGKIAPVFRERINHGIDLLQKGQVNYLLFTGGYGEGQKISDSQCAKNYAMSLGIPANKIYLEEKSTFTFTNLQEAKKVMVQNQLANALIISDPYHMKRAMRMATKLQINSLPSPTPTSRYRSKKAKLKLLLSETFFYSFGFLKSYNL